MELILTRHAKNRMRLYAVAEREVRQSATHPEEVSPGLFGAQHLWTRLPDGRWLRVTCIDEGVQRVVITVTPKRHGPGGAHAH